MPGIFVHPVGQLGDWNEEGKEPILTVPGSYWLCHKKNIYKFTLKFHKSIRNTDEFNYSKDLMRVIRRILKCNPPQGQQFSTKNLFVEYNQTSWTRPDKMFAMLKFKDKDAMVYQQAFILTIKIMSLLTTDKATNETLRERRSDRGRNETDVKTVIQIKTASSTSQKNKDLDFKESRLSSETSSKLDVSEPDSKNVINVHDISSENNENANMSFLVSECDVSKSNMSSLDISETCTYNSSNSIESPKLKREEENSKSESKPWSSKPVTLKTSTEEEDIQIDVDEENEEVSDMKLRLEPDSEEEMDLDEDIDVCESDSKDNHIGQPNGDSVDEESSDKDEENDEVDNSEISNTDSNDLDRSILGSALSEQQESRESEDVMVDSTCLPYQYLIERDIENSRIKCIQKNSSNSEDAATSDATEDPVEMHCLDMTDLVMKGLMFTLRQEEDSVKIVKQTTKVEVDEVLENSEKVETKEGDPCLLNSSLLKLESMITNIDNRNKPTSNFDKLYESLATLIGTKKDETIKDSEAQKNVPSELSNNVIVSPTDAIECAKKKVDEDTEMLVDVAEEEVIPETLQRNLMEVEKPEEYEGLVMDDFEETVTWKTIVNKEKENVAVGEKPVQTTKGPKVISDEIIKNNDLPHSLLSMLINNKMTTSRTGAKDSSPNVNVVNGSMKVVQVPEKPESEPNKMPVQVSVEEPLSEVDLNTTDDVVERDSTTEETVEVKREIKEEVNTENESEVNNDERNESETMIYENNDECNKSRTSNDAKIKEEHLDEYDNVVGDEDQDVKPKIDLKEMPQRRYPRRGLHDTNQPVYVFKNKYQRYRHKPFASASNKKIDICKLIEDLSKGARVLVKRLDPKTLRS